MSLSVSLPAGGHLDHFCALLEPFLHMSPSMCVREPHEGGGGGPGEGGTLDCAAQGMVLEVFQSWYLMSVPKVRAL